MSWARLPHGALLRALLVLFCTTLPGSEPLAQDPFDLTRPHVRLYGLEQGLPGSTVYNLGRDPSGHLWAATQEGAARFDGLTWTPVHPPSAKGPCRAVLPLADGTLWLGFEAGGLWRRKGGAWTDFVPKVGINHILETREGLWATTRGEGLLRWTGSDWVPSGLPGQWVWKLHEGPGPDGRTHLWAAGRQGLWVLESEGWRRIGADQPFLDEINGLDTGLDASGRFQLWASCWRKGVARWDGATWELHGLAEGCPSLLPTALRFDPAAPGGPTVWVGAYDRGLMWYRDGKWASVGSTHRGDLYGVYSLLVTPDVHPGLWFGTRGRGVGNLDLGGWRTLNAAIGLVLDSVSTVASDGRRVWVGSSGGLTRIEGGRIQVESGPGAPATITNGVLVEGEGPAERVWAATTLGLHLKENGRWRALRKPDGVPELPAYSLLRTVGPKGSRLWVGTERGLMCQEGGRWITLNREEGAPGEWVYALAQAPGPGGEPDLWVGMRDAGVARFRAGHWTLFPVGPDHPKAWCNGLVVTEGRDGRKWLWAAFVGLGLGRLEVGLEGAGWRIWGPDNLPGFPTATVFGVAAQPKGMLFLGTSKGVVRLDLTEGAEGPLPTTLRVFTRGDGLPSAHTGYYASLVDARGRIWMGTDQGLGVLDPSLAAQDRPLPLPVIESLEVGGITVPSGGGAKVDYRAKRFRTTFFWPVYHRREDARFRTQLVGLEAEPGPWEPEAHREFTGLPRGRYTLRLWAKDHAGREVGPVAWAFEVRAAPWLSGWALAAYGLALTLALWGALRWRLLRLQREKGSLQAEIERALASQAEKQRALQASEERYALAALGANEGIWDHNLLTGKIHVSDRLPEILGLGPEAQELDASTWEGSIHPEDLGAVGQALIAHIKHHLPYDVEFRLRTHAGAYRWFRSRGQALWGPDGRATRMGGSIGDITERKRADAELLAAKASLEARNQELEELDETVKAINLEMDLETLIHELLAQITARFPQVQRSMFLLRHKTDQTFHCEAVHCDLPEVAKASREFVLPVAPAEAWFRSRPEDFARGVCLVDDVPGLPGFNRMRFPPRAMLLLPILIEGSMEGILALHNDQEANAFAAADLEKLLRFREHIISAVAKARTVQDLDDLNRNLAEAMQTADSAREIAEYEREEARKARALAEQASQAKSAFLANMSHEIRTPMNAVMGFSQLGQKLDLEAKPREYFQKIATASRSLLGIINDILDFSKVEAGKMELETIPFRLSQVVANVRDLFAQGAADKGLAFSVTVADGTPDVLLGDPLRLGQVLINLTSNALKFTARGKVAVAVSATPAEGDLTLFQFEVRDTGIGLSPEQAQGLFQPFSQADSSTTRKFGGTGLGLTISKRIVELLGGALTLESEPGKGSCFRFQAAFLRATPEQAAHLLVAEQEPLNAQGAPDLAGLRVLLVEDNPINQEVAKELLATLGIVPQVASSGLEALRWAESQAFDVVLMDVQMPGMDGYETTARIREMPAHADLPILAMTANALDQDRIACLEAGMNDFIPKPIEPQELFSALRRWSQPTPKPVAPVTLPEPPSDLPLLDRVGALRRLGGNEALLQRLWDDFCREQAGDAAAIRQALTVGDLKQAEHLAHTLKGVAGNLGAKRLQEAAAALEKPLRARDSHQVAALLPALEAVLEATLALPPNP